jgi:hypothetical protein
MLTRRAHGVTATATLRASHVTQQVVQVQFDGIRGVGDRHDGRQSDERA